MTTLNLNVSPVASLDDLAARNGVLKTRMAAFERRAETFRDPKAMDANLVGALSLFTGLSKMLKETDLDELLTTIEAVEGKDGVYVMTGYEAQRMGEQGANLEDMGTGMYIAAATVLPLYEHVFAQAKQLLDQHAVAAAARAAAAAPGAGESKE